MQNQAQVVDFHLISSANPDHHRAWSRGMSVARIELDNSQMKKEFLVWASAAGLEDADDFSAFPDWRFMTVGRMAWLVNNGAEMPEQSLKFMSSQLDIMRSKTAETQSEEQEPVISADAKKTIQYVNLYSKLDTLWMKHQDDLELLEDEVRKFFNSNQTPMALLRRVYQHFKESLDDAMTGRDNPEVAKWIEPLVVVVNVLAGSTGNAQAMNAMRRKVNMKAVKAAKNATVKIVDQETNIVGLSPALLVGCTHALVYNTKNRKAMLYVAVDGATLGVKGTYITGYDENASFGKTLRKPKESFPKLLHNATANRIKKVLSDNIKGKSHTLNGKLNKETLLVKVFK